MILPKFDIDAQVIDNGVVFVLMSDTLLEMPPVWVWIVDRINEDMRYWILKYMDESIRQARYLTLHYLYCLMERDALWEWPQGRWDFDVRYFPTRLQLMMRESMAFELLDNITGKR